MDNVAMSKVHDEFMESVVKYLEEGLKAEGVKNVQVIRLRKDNEVYTDTLMLVCDDVFYIFYLKDYFMDFISLFPFKTLIQNIDVQKTLLESVKTIYLEDAVTIRENIIIHMISATKNKELLAKCPHRILASDLAITYRLVIQKSDTGIATTIIDDEMAMALHLDEDQLYTLASQNYRRMFPTTIMTAIETVKPQHAQCEELYIMSNNMHLFGASGLCDLQPLHKFAIEKNTDFYILPSSIHEVLLIPEDKVAEVFVLKLMVCDINRSILEPDEFLSDSVYFYSRSKGFKRLI